jgi:flagellar protein FlbD
MISATPLKGGEFTLNAELIEYIESAQGTTVITLITGKKIIVRESRDELVTRILDYRREIANVKPDPLSLVE